MGRIKISLVKRTARKFVSDKKVEFSEDFNVNKKILGRSMPSKLLRNKIAGYISRLKKFESKENLLKEDMPVANLA